MVIVRSTGALIGLLGLALGCGTKGDDERSDSGGGAGNGGASTGGSTASGGTTPASGGSTAGGGTTPMTGGTPSGGATSTGGAQSGGVTATGGRTTGGISATGGRTTGGTSTTGGRTTGGSTNTGGTNTGGTTSTGGTPIRPACAAVPGGGSATVARPTRIATLFDRWHEAWLASPAVVDLDGDGTKEIVVARDEVLLAWHLDNTQAFRVTTGGRIWSSPVVADLVTSSPGLEVAVASRGRIHAYTARGVPLPGFPVTLRDELRSLAAGNIDTDPALELVAVTTSPLAANGQRDIVYAVNPDGTVVAGFPPNTTGTAGCDAACYVTGGYDQNLALGDLNGDGRLDILAPQDNAYISLHHGSGVAFDAATIFRGRTKFSGIRFLHDYAEAQQGYANNEATAHQAHFTNSAPAIADVDGDGTPEVVVLASVQNAAQTDRLRGVALWVTNPDGTRPTGWTTPFHAPDYLAGLWDFDGTNVVGATNQVTVADLDPAQTGPEFVFAGFDGAIHCVSARRTELWKTPYTTSARVLTGGVVVGDLSGDGVPELVFNTYSPDTNLSHLFVLSAAGRELHRIALTGRGAMPVPTLADVNGNGTLEIVVSLKDGTDRVRQVEVYEVAGSSTNCLPWPTGRANLLRNGYVP